MTYYLIVTLDPTDPTKLAHVTKYTCKTEAVLDGQSVLKRYPEAVVSIKEI